MFENAKQAVKQVQALGIYGPSCPGELNVHVTQKGFSWGLWQRHGKSIAPLGFGPSCGEEQNSTAS